MTPFLISLFLATTAPAQAKDPPPAPEGSVAFAPSEEVFSPLLADPREIQLSASYYRWNGENAADVALGHSWGMSRWYAQNGKWAFQWDLEGMAYSRFLVSGAVNKFETVDFIARLPIEVRRDWFSGKFMLFHESSHLGDDYIRDTGNTGFRYSIDGLRGMLSDDLTDWARAYMGGSYLLHTVPSPDRGALQWGFELMTHDLRAFEKYTFKCYAAQDFQSFSNVGWNINSSSALGLRLGQRQGTRAMRLELGYFAGHSPFGQFYLKPEHYADIRLALDL